MVASEAVRGGIYGERGLCGGMDIGADVRAQKASADGATQT